MMTTKLILASQALDMVIHQGWIDWAVEMLVKGHDSPMLRVMAGESAPFNGYELRSMVDRVIDELGLEPFTSRSDALMALLECRVQQIVDGEMTRADGLRELNDISLRLDRPDELMDFCMLHWALTDLRDAKDQWYWPDADRSNIDGIIDQYCVTWLAKRS